MLFFFFLYLSANKICACTKAVFECTEIKPAKNSDFCDPAGIFFKLGNTEVCVLSDLNHEPWRRANDFLFLTPNLQLEHSLCEQISLKLYLRLHLPYLTLLTCFVHCNIFFCSSECVYENHYFQPLLSDSCKLCNCCWGWQFPKSALFSVVLKTKLFLFNIL